MLGLDPMNNQTSGPLSEVLSQFSRLVEIVAKLRGPGGCPWDQGQTQKSLVQYAIEEAFELAEAIESKNQKATAEELGDFLFQVILQAQVAQDLGHFSLADVITVLNEKMVRRHPHVFSAGEVTNKTIGLDDVWKNWERLKNEEKAAKQDNSIFGLPIDLPALQSAYKIGVKTERYKFDWENPAQVFAKVEEESREVAEALVDMNPKELEHEIGDLLFSVAQLARHLKMEPEQCLRVANRRFEDRFRKVLELSGVHRDQFIDLPSKKKEELWAQAKAELQD